MDLRVPRFFALGLLAAALAGCTRSADPRGAAAGGRPRGSERQPVEVAPVVRRDLIDTLVLVGSLAANESAEIRPEVSGLVREILFAEGQSVTRGQPLLRIDDAELRAQFEQVEARFKLAEQNVARSESLSESRTIAQSETDRVRAEFAVARAERELLRTRLEKTEIKAPFDGIVGGRIVSPGDYVTAATVITQIDDLSRLKVEFQVPERYIEKVARGTSFALQPTISAQPEAVRGEVYFVSPVIDRNTRSIEVKGILEAPPATLRPGMFAPVELVLEVRKAALTVPEGSILVSSAGPQVIAVRGAEGQQVAEFVPVQTGLRSRGLVEVSSVQGTLVENESVVASGVGALILFPGAQLDPRPLRAEFRVSQ